MDPWLSPFKEELKKRYSKAQDWIKKIDETEGGLDKFSRVGTPQLMRNPNTDLFQGFEKFGINVDSQNNITYREWAPNATQAFFIGEFSISLPPL